MDGQYAIAHGSPQDEDTYLLHPREVHAAFWEFKGPLCFFGHTHLPFWEVMQGVLLLNPGSLSRPRGSFGPSFAVLEAPPLGMGAIDVKIYELSGGAARPRFTLIRP